MQRNRDSVRELLKDHQVICECLVMIVGVDIRVITNDSSNSFEWEPRSGCASERTAVHPNGRPRIRTDSATHTHVSSGRRV